VVADRSFLVADLSLLVADRSDCATTDEGSPPSFPLWQEQLPPVHIRLAESRWTGEVMFSWATTAIALVSDVDCFNCFCDAC